MWSMTSLFLWGEIDPDHDVVPTKWALFWFVSFSSDWLPVDEVLYPRYHIYSSLSLKLNKMKSRPIKNTRTIYPKKGRVQSRGLWRVRLAHHPLSSSSSSSSTSSSGCSAMAEDSFVLKLLRISRVCRGGQRGLTQPDQNRTAFCHQMCRAFTCCSLFDPFCFCFRRPSYGFRPSRYSATASLDGFFSKGERDVRY